ncbi:MAG: type I restriction enzyme HsdR N-terminal domain-containing protein [Bacteroidales bacterium]
MHKLNLPNCKLKIKELNSKKYVFDAIRKKYLLLTPEEWVRQNFIYFLIHFRGVPSGLLSLEKGIKVNTMFRRTDIVIYSSTGDALCIVECKAAKVKITHAVFEQIARYNMALRVPYLVVTNGLQTYTCYIDYAKSRFQFLKNLPRFEEMDKRIGEN